VRYRQELCLAWIAKKVHVETVLTQLGAANFDPEFHPQHEAELVRLYNEQTGKQLNLQRRRGLAGVRQLLQELLNV
jgi:hypothetical protein